jgi:hypothetical protein
VVERSLDTALALAPFTQRRPGTLSIEILGNRPLIAERLQRQLKGKHNPTCPLGDEWIVCALPVPFHQVRRQVLSIDAGYLFDGFGSVMTDVGVGGGQQKSTIRNDLKRVECRVVPRYLGIVATRVQDRVQVGPLWVDVMSSESR